jgi:hypothetical protein
MFQESRNDMWQYRRNPSIQKPLEEIGHISEDGIPYLRPEIQLLFKGGGAAYREKDTCDLVSLLRAHSLTEKAWLIDALQTEFPGGHEWIRIIQNRDYA